MMLSYQQTFWRCVIPINVIFAGFHLVNRSLLKHTMLEKFIVKRRQSFQVREHSINVHDLNRLLCVFIYMLYHLFRFYLSEVWSNMTKQRVPNKISEFNTSMHEVIPPGMREDWCPVCQLHLSSQIVAISHYKGKPFYKYFRHPLLTL